MSISYNVATKPPTGLQITRNGMTFTLSWKVGDESYFEQAAEYRLLDGLKKELQAWTPLTIIKGETSATFTVSLQSYVLMYVETRVKGKRDAYTKELRGLPDWTQTVTVLMRPDWSEWSSTSMVIYMPVTPTLSDGWESGHPSNSAFPYSISETTAPDKERPIISVQYQTTVFTNLNTTPQNANWNAVPLQTTTALSGTFSYSETGLTGSKTRAIRVRGIGPAGAGPWAYASHVYAAPYAPVIRSANATKGAGNTVNLTVKWGQQVDEAHPTDYCQVEYLITEPAAGLAVPPGATFTSLDQVAVRKGYDNTFSAIIPTSPDRDQVLFVRVHSWHDNRDSVSTTSPMVMTAKLRDPSGVAITTYPATNTAKITATNNSGVGDSILAVEWRENGKRSFIAGIIPHGETEVTITVPAWTNAVAVAVQAVVGTVTFQAVNNIKYYTITKKLQSDIVEKGGNVPLAPASVSVTPSSTWSGTAVVQWSWNWAEADSAEVSWSDNPDAWESTKAPSSYEIQNVYAGKWNVPELTMGVRWYFRVRFLQRNNDVVTYGPYSTPVSTVLYSAPAVPSLTLSKGVAAPSDTVTASWAYVSTDGTQQAYAELNTYPASSKPIAKVSSGQSVSFTPGLYGWAAGSTQQIRVRVVSASNMTSEWSEPVPLMIAPDISITLSNVSITNGILSELPLTLTVTGAGTAGTTTVAVERINDYKMVRPDGTATYGYNGETVAMKRVEGEGGVSITAEDILPGGHLDDGASYALVATIKDVYGRKRTTRQTFTVEWSHKAQKAEATVELQDDIAIITPTAQSGGIEGDYADIYRLSIDGATLLYHMAEFGTSYVDPYPTIGPFGGYRVVYCTVNGDYVSENGSLMWTDYQTVYKSVTNIINTSEDRIEIMYNVEQTDSWDKEFSETKYLGGSVVGDWLAGVSRKTGINAQIVRTQETLTDQALRRLAEYTGRCHVRSVDGSNFWADVQVSRTGGYSAAGKAISVSLSMTRVDQGTPDGVPLSEWEA